MSNKISGFSARSGRMMREDGSVINAADILDMIAKGQLKVQLDGDSIVIDNVEIGAELGIKDGENKLKVNADGSIDTKLTGSIVAEAKSKRIPIIGDVVEPYEEGYKGVVGIFGHALFWHSEVFDKEIGAIRQKGDSVYVAVRDGNLIKYTSGIKQWEYKLGSDEITDIAFDGEGNIYIGSWYSGDVAKISDDGNEIKRINGLFTVGGNARSAYAITDESDGHLFICGGTVGGEGAVMKIDKELNVVNSAIQSELIQTAIVAGGRLVLGLATQKIRGISLNSFVENWSRNVVGAVENLVHEARTNKLYAVTRSRVYDVNPSTGTAESILTLNTQEFKGQGRSLAVDFEGSLYIGTSDSKVYKVTASGDIQWVFDNPTGRVLTLDVDDEENLNVGATDVKAISTSMTFKGYKIVGGA